LQFVGSIDEPERIYLFFNGNKISENKYNIEIVMSINIDNIFKIINDKYIPYAIDFYQVIHMNISRILFRNYDRSYQIVFYM
jgi:hypothetical protein